MASPSVAPACTICHSIVPLKKCGRCQSALYCSSDCQRSDWPSHKSACRRPRLWYDIHRNCDDGGEHEGRLELITWSTPAADTHGEDMGWGNCLAEESEDLKRKFEDEFGGDEEKLYEYWPQAFRWTCCGGQGDLPYGCDHHGRGTKPCSCDYCHVSKADSR